MPVAVFDGKHASVVQQLAEDAQVPGAETAQRVKHEIQHSMRKAASDMSAYEPALRVKPWNLEMVPITLTSCVLSSSAVEKDASSNPSAVCSKHL